jgi:hypothetical protein
MASSTYAQLVTKTENDLDIADETFITPTELLGIFNEGVAMIQDEIHTLYEDYYLTSYAVPLVTSTSEYAFPSTTYLQKLRGLVYNNGSQKYEVKKIRKLSETALVQDSDDYRFLIINDATTGVKLKLYPASRETSSSVMTLWFIRQVNKFEDDDSVCDLPEAFEPVLLQYVRWRVHGKEGHPDTAQDLADLTAMKTKMVDTMKDRIVDEDTQLIMDMSFYDDFDGRDF